MRAALSRSTRIRHVLLVAGLVIAPLLAACDPTKGGPGVIAQPPPSASASVPAPGCAAADGSHGMNDTTGVAVDCPKPGSGVGSPSAGAKPSTPAATVTAKPQPTKSFAGPPPQAQYREFAANCTETHRLDDDPIVFPGLAGAAHNHTFIGNPSTKATSTPESLLKGASSCQDKKDSSSYWFPTLYQNGTVVQPQTVTAYYKSGVKDYRTVLPFPAGFRLIVGDMRTRSAADFKGTWSCGGTTTNDFPASCPSGSSLIVRLQAPSCWDGVHLDTADHKSHMAWPVNGVCTASHPVPLPMFEMKVPYKLPGGSTGGLEYSSGKSYSFHYDFMNGWDAARQKAVIEHCVNGGRQCNGLGVDDQKP